MLCYKFKIGGRLAAPTNPKKIGPVLALTLHEISSYYTIASGGKDLEFFKQNFTMPILEVDYATGENLLKEFLKRTDLKAPLQFTSAPYAICAAYCIQAMKALDKIDIEKSWEAAAEARYWCGVARASHGVAAIQAEIQKMGSIRNGEKGGKKAHKADIELRRYTENLIEEADKAGKFVNNMTLHAEQLAPHVEKYAQAIGIFLDDPVGRTYVYLTSMRRREKSK